MIRGIYQRLTFLTLTALSLIACDGGDQIGSSDHQIRALAFDGVRYVAATPGGVVLTSTDAIHWQAIDVPGTLDTRVMATFQGEFVGISYVIGVAPELAIDSGNVILSSTDGLNWRTAPLHLPGMVTGLATDNQQLVAVSDNGVMLSSNDATNWQKTDLRSDSFDGISYLANTFIAWNGTTIYRSSNGSQWQATALPDAMQHIQTAASDGNTLIMAGLDGQLWRLDNDDQWQQLPAPSQAHFHAIAWGRDRFIAVGYENNRALIWESTDGTYWNPIPLPTKTPPLYSIIWDSTGFVIGGAGSTILRYDGATITTFISDS